MTFTFAGAHSSPLLTRYLKYTEDPTTRDYISNLQVTSFRSRHKASDLLEFPWYLLCSHGAQTSIVSVEERRALLIIFNDSGKWLK